MNTRKHSNAQAAFPALLTGKVSFPNEPIDSVYNCFQQGDILFGLAASVGAVRKELEAKGYHHLYANSLNSPVVDIVMEDDKSPKKIAKLDEPQREHLRFLEQHQDYLKRKPTGKPVPLMRDSKMHGSGYRRACKLLLINRDAGRKKNAHFLIKDIIWKRVCDKTLSKDGVTDSELRAAFRDYLKNGPNPHVFFYDDQCRLLDTPPWKDKRFAKHWEHYQKEREKKKSMTP